MKTYCILAFYTFVELEDPHTTKNDLLLFCKRNDIKGSIILANEGINGTITGSEESIDAFLAYLQADARFAKLEQKKSYADFCSFKRLKILVKKEIVTLRQEGVSPLKKVGTYVEPKNWNALLEDPEVILVDTRNDYEYQIGTFENARNPETRNFRDFPEYVKKNLDPQKHKKVAMFCTGGIRCEKSTSYLLGLGFENVYHLKGGILKYLEEIPEEKSKWQGECFVFDERVAVAHGLKVGKHNMCFGCGNPIAPEDIKSPLYEKGVTCPKCFHIAPEKTKALCRERQHQLDVKSAK